MKPDNWLGVELRHFAALQALAETGSFGRAAERLGYTQSAVSQQIATLERIVGERLVERPGGPRRIGITAAGLLLLRHAESIVARVQAAQADMAALHAGEAGTISVGTFQSVGARLLPEIMRRFSAQFPAIDVTLREEDDDDLALTVERGELDVGFVLLPLADAPLEAVELLRDPYVLITAADSAFARAETAPRLREVAAEPLIGFRYGRSMLPLEAALRASGVEPSYVFRSNDNGTVQGLVAAGIGNAVLPLLTVDTADPRIAVLPLGRAVSPRLIAIARHRDRYHAPAVRAFVETARDVCAAVSAGTS